MRDYGIKISKKGGHLNSSKPDDFILNTKYKTSLFFKTGIITHTFNTDSHTTEKVEIAKIKHDLGYLPICNVYSTEDNSKWYKLPSTYNQKFSYCPGCTETCTNNKDTCYANFNACMNDDSNQFSACLDAYPYEFPDRWDEWVAGCTAASDARVAICKETYGYQEDGQYYWLTVCDTAYWNCYGECSDHAPFLYEEFTYEIDENYLYIYFNKKVNSQASCSPPSGDWSNMIGKTFKFKFTISTTKMN